MRRRLHLLKPTSIGLTQHVNWLKAEVFAMVISCVWRRRALHEGYEKMTFERGRIMFNAMKVLEAAIFHVHICAVFHVVDGRSFDCGIKVVGVAFNFLAASSTLSIDCER
jgi:hypothetical protein